MWRVEEPSEDGTRLASDSHFGGAHLKSATNWLARHRAFSCVTGWIVLIGGLLCLFYTEVWLVGAASTLFGEYATHHWQTILAPVLIVLFVVISGVATKRAISAFRVRSAESRFVFYAAVCFCIGVVEVVVAVFFSAPVLLTF
jgi:hypothetical protein